MAFSPLSGSAGLDLDFISKLERLRQIMPNGLGSQISIKSGYRSPERQAFLFDRAVRKYGSVAAARKWVAPPGRSQHGNRKAADLGYGSRAAMQAAHQYAPQVGLVFPMSWEDWHIEPIGARGGKSTPARTAAEAGAGLVTDSTGPGLASAFSGVSGGGVGGGAGGEEGGGLPKISAGGPPRGAGLIYGDTPQIDTSLETMPATPSPETYATPEGVPMESLASLFKLPTIAGSDPLLDADAPPGLPGQAKPLTRKVWR